MKKRFSAFLLAALMVAALLPAMSFADAPAAMIENQSYDSVLDALKDSKNGDTITIMPGTHLVGDLTHVHFYANGDSTPSNLTIVGQGEGVELDALYFNVNAFPQNLTVKNITFVGDENVPGAGGISSAKEVTNLWVENCQFLNGTFLSLANEIATNITVKNCVFDGVSPASSPVYIQKVNGLTVTGCIIKNGGYNAIQSNSSVEGSVTITDNTFSGLKSRNIYLNGIGDSYAGTLTVSGNKFCIPTDPKPDGNFIKTNKTSGVVLGVNTYPVAVNTDSPDSLYFTGVSELTPPPAYAGPVMNWVKVNAADNGVVKSGPLAASAGATVTLYPKAAEGYVLDTVEVLDAEGNAVELDGLKFAIPAGGVTVNATFKLAE